MITARYFSSDSSDSGSLRTPCPPPACAAGRQGITPAFGYSAPHPSAGGTLTLLIHALPSTHYDDYLKSFAADKRILPTAVARAAVATAAEIESEVGKLAAPPAGGLIVAPDTFTVAHRQTILASVAQHAVPAIHAYRQVVVEGGLMSYAPDTLDIFRRSAGYIDRILKGAKPGDLPAQAPIKFEFVLNLKTAKALGLDVPPTLLALADEVIE